MKRRTVIAGVAAAGAAAAAGLYRFTDIFVKHYPPTPYDDLLVQLVDRQQAARLGAKLAGAPDADALAAQLRAGLKPHSLTAVAEADAAAPSSAVSAVMPAFSSAKQITSRMWGSSSTTRMR